jgi:excinuclease ABC subunit B
MASSAFFPENAVGYFISYYDYYQPEAYVPSTNTYIAKDASINDDIDRLRLQATSMLLEREDVVIVASVSCIYGLGTPEDWKGMRLNASAGQQVSRHELLEKLVSIQYQRNDVEVARGCFRVRGDVVDVHPAYEDVIIRIELDDDRVARISALDPLTGQLRRRMERLALYPAKHFVTPEPRLQAALSGIRSEMEAQVAKFRAEGKLLEAQRIRQRTGTTSRCWARSAPARGSRTSRATSGRAPGERPGCLIDYFRTSSCWWWTSRTSRCRRSAACSRATARASRSWWTSASACRPRSTTGRCVSTSSRRSPARRSTCRRRRPNTSWRSRRA